MKPCPTGWTDCGNNNPSDRDRCVSHADLCKYKDVADMEARLNNPLDVEALAAAGISISNYQRLLSTMTVGNPIFEGSCPW